ncbi:NAD(P)H-dependent oxidoreductase [Protaetiibacter sp. SSC-01]|uniref:NAD(P)H-dependent oxidoreductase n=1 Tax=Protaetiibacter sp. SSC-01 TaxID=2759943 RepID=UPI0016575406|nr:NAD(P)H-dependent oxidoreductase [Protaetiibacter sp. SSC-01]QNO38370.1 NAD(P)H-dependent oxidoreductase [Protaetiibacter sp. SSC-01]
MTLTSPTDTGTATTNHDPRRILVVIGHPIAGSLNHALAAAYVEHARPAAEVRVHDLAAIRIPHTDAREQLRAWDGDTTPLEPVVRELIDDLVWAEHVVILFPQWWGTYPAALKAYLDRVVLSGVAFRYRTGQIPRRLLAGRTARILMTADGPAWWNRMRYRNAAETSLARATLEYCGIRVRGITRFMKVRFSTPEQRAGWIREAGRLGARDAAHARRR